MVKLNPKMVASLCQPGQDLASLTRLDATDKDIEEVRELRR